MRASVRRTIVAVACTATAISTLGLVALGGAERGTGDQARAQGSGAEPPGPFPDVYAPGDEYTVPGERDGTSTFPTVRYRQLQPKQPGVMDFEHYHSEAEMNWWMRKWAYEHPQFVDLDQVGDELRREADLPAHDHQQGVRRGDRQAGRVLRRRAPLG